MKTTTTLAVTILIFSCIDVFSQSPVKQWDADFGGTDYEQFAAVQQTKDGGYIAGGYSESGISGDKTQDSRGSSDYWIVKTGANGSKQWDARFGGTSVDQLTCLQQTADGGYILGGISFSGAGGDKTQDSRGSSDYWIVKINSNGVKQWDARFGGSLQDEMHAVQQTADGGYILAGSSISNISGDKTQNSRGGKDFWIVKTDDKGVKQWDARFGGNLFEELFSVSQTKDGGYILGGYSLSNISGDKSEVTKGRFDFWIVKTNANGAKQWDKDFGGTDDDWLAQLQQTTDGGYILGGWSWSGATGDKTQPTKGVNDYWMIKTDENGSMQWDADFGGNSNDYLTGIQQTTDGGYILGGYSSSPISGNKTENTQGGVDYWMVKTDDSGMQLWDKDFGGNDFDFCYGIDETTDGGFVLGGYTSSNASGDKSEDTKGFNDYWIVKTSPAAIACETPVNLRSAGISSTEGIVRWHAIKSAEKYVIAYKKTGTFKWSLATTKNNYDKLNDLSAATSYLWKVKTVCGEQPLVSSRWSAPDSFTTTSALQQTEISSITKKEYGVQVYPNPVMQSADILFSLSKMSVVSMVVINANGTKIKTIVDASFAAGSHTVHFNRGGIAAGTYFLQVRTNENITIKKLVLQ